MKTKEERIEEIKAASLKAIQEVELECKLIELFPVDGYEFFSIHAYKAEASVNFKVQTRADMLELLGKLPAIDLILHKDSCMSFFPACRIEDDDRGTLLPIEQVYYKLDRVLNYPTVVTFNWFTKVQDHIYAIHVVVAQDPGRIEGNVRYNNQGEALSSEWRCTTDIHGHLTKWASGSIEYPNSYTIHWDNHTKLKGVI